jgi:predicted enzyme related to lactoylglutathione lyase
MRRLTTWAFSAKNPRVGVFTMSNTFDWIEIRTDDIGATAQFFESLFGWKVTQKLEADGSHVWLFDTGDTPRLENLRRGGIWLRPQGEPLGVMVYILVEDIEATLRKVSELGGEVLSPKTPQGPTAFRASFSDPSGIRLSLWEENNDGM